MGSSRVPLVVFSLDGQKLALPLDVVHRVVRAAQVCPVPGAPAVVCGLLDLQGEVIAVIDLRARLGLPCGPVGVDDLFLIVQSSRRTLALVAEQVHGLVQGELQDRKEPWLQRFEGLAQTADGLVLVEDIEAFLTPAESLLLDRALEPTE
jgi:purine-binding chemotaxis protein CheW